VENDEPRPFNRGGKGPRYDVKNSIVQEMLDSGVSICEVARKLDCSDALICQIKMGLRRDQRRPKHLDLRGQRICTCCGVRPVKKGNHFLCEICFRSGSNGEIAVDSVCCYASI